MSYRKQVIEEYTDLLEHQSQIMHRMLMILTAASSLLFFCIDLFVNELQEALITLSILPLTGVTFLLYRFKWIYASKLFSIIQVEFVIAVLSIYVGADSLVFMFIFPIVIAAFVLFQGKQIVTAYILAILSFIVLLLCIYADTVWGHSSDIDTNVGADRYMNVTGVAVTVITQLIYITRVSASIQKRLLASSKALDLRNNQLTSTIYTRDRMMSVISHDLRSPVATLDTAADILQEGGLDSEVQKSFLKQFKSKTASLLIMIDQLLDWSRTQTNTIKMNREEISIGEIDRHLRNISGLLSSDKRVKINVDFAGAEDDVIHADKHMLEGIFRNLISNAVKFSAEDSVVRVYTRKLNHAREFIVEDFGKGMTPEQVENLKQGVSFSTEGTFQEIGHGFGLQLVKEFLERHGSALQVQSTLGKGSRFSFVI